MWTSPPGSSSSQMGTARNNANDKAQRAALEPSSVPVRKQLSGMDVGCKWAASAQRILVEGTAPTVTAKNFDVSSILEKSVSSSGERL